MSVPATPKLLNVAEALFMELRTAGLIDADHKWATAPERALCFKLARSAAEAMKGATKPMIKASIRLNGPEWNEPKDIAATHDALMDAAIKELDKAL